MIEGLRSIGVRYVVVHQSLFSDRPEFGWSDPKDLVEAIDRATGARGRQFNDSVAWLLETPRPRLPVDEAALEPVSIGGSMATASAMAGRLRYAFDGNIDTKWLTAAPQTGEEWVKLSFAEDMDIRRLVVLTSPFGVGDYPRGLVVESEAADGGRMTLYEGSFLPALIGGLATGARGAPAVLDLPSNRSRALWIRQTGRSERWQWAIHELQVFRRRPSS